MEKTSLGAFHVFKYAFQSCLGSARNNLLGYLLKMQYILHISLLEPEIYHICSLLNKVEKL